MRNFFVALGLILSSFSTFAHNGNVVLKEYEIPKPEGLSWGVSQNDLIQVGYQLSDCNTMNNFTFCSLDNPKEPIANSLYALVFENKFGLVQELVSVSVPTDNNTGLQLVPDYYKFKAMLSNKYGKPLFETEHSSEVMNTDIPDFSSCLREGTQCAVYLSQFVKNGAEANLFIAPIDKDDNRIIIDYRAPIYKQLVDNQTYEKNNEIELI